MEHRVEGEGEQHHQTDPQDHRTQLQVTPVDDVEHCKQGVEWNDRGWSAGGGVAGGGVE